MERQRPLGQDALSFITKKRAINFLKFIDDSTADKIDLADEFSFASKDSIEILKSLLTVNPYLRPSASQLLKNPYFDDVRVPEIEYQADKKISLDFDEKGKYDYKNDKDKYFHNMAWIKEAIIAEIELVQKNK